jgi:hypothetical protein
MFETFPVKKSAHRSEKVLATVFALTLAIFHSTNAAGANELILDNGEAGTSFTERWNPWNTKKNQETPYGKNSLYTYSAGATYTYHFDLPAAGEYQVFAWWSASKIHSTSVPYDIIHQNGTSTVTANQQKNGGQWNQLGTTWNFDKTATITIRPLGVGTVIADAIMLVPMATNTNVDTAPVNTAPMISGVPAGSVTANEGYSFQPSASDADGDQLTFNISNKPAWAGFSTSSGRLSGTPTDSQVNTYSGIVISVTDGTDTASLPVFSIIVSGTQTQTGSITLNWTAPVARTDGSPITMSEIAGYNVYYGPSAGSYPNQLSVNDGSSTSATITDLLTGTYYLVVTTEDYEGRESAYSSEIARAVP